MAHTFFFYDLETSGLNARQDRIMQFAGRRTDAELNTIGEPYSILVALNDDTLPNPEAIMVTGITPQKTREEGYTEAEFTRILMEQVFTPDTITVGFNNVRFDDEFIRHLLWRNFYDPYEWAYKDGRSRWDLLDVARMTRALRPEGIEWPVVDGKAVNKLELITKINGIDHYKAHDALSDVEALIAVTKLIKQKQPQLYEYLLRLRDKNEVKKLVNIEQKQPFVYVSGRYDAEFNKATVAFPLTAGPNGGIIVYDLRYDPAAYVDLSVQQLTKQIFATWEQRQKDDFLKVPVKALQYNKAPAVAPLGVLGQANGWEKVGLTIDIIEKHKTALLAAPHFAENVRTVFESRPEFKKSADPEAQLYDGFLSDRDRVRVEAVRNATERTLADFQPDFADERLVALLVHYKARNYPKTMSESEMKAWEQWRRAHLQEQLPGYAAALQRLSTTTTDDSKQFILQELQLWAESIVDSAED